MLGAVHAQHIPIEALISRSVSVASVARAFTFAAPIGASPFYPAQRYIDRKTESAEDCMTIDEGSELENGV